MMTPSAKPARSAGQQFNGCLSPSLRPETADVLHRPWRGVFLSVRALDGIADAAVSRRSGADADFSFADADRPASVFEQGAVPPAGTQGPGTHEDAAVHDDRPDPDEPMIG